MSAPILTPEEIRKLDFYKALQQRRRNDTQATLKYLKALQSMPPPDRRSNISKVLGGTFNFGKSTLKDIKDVAVKTWQGLGDIARGERAGYQQSQKTDMLNANSKIFSNYMRGLSDEDWNKPEVKKQIKTYTDTAKKLQGEVQNPNTVQDLQKLQGIDAKQLAFQAAETALNLSLVGGPVKGLIKGVAKGGTELIFKQAAEQALKTGGTDAIEALAKERGGLALEKIAAELEKQGGKKAAESTMFKIAKNLATDVPFGAAFGATMTGASNPDATGADIAKGALTVGGIGAVAGIAGPLVGDFLKRFKGKAPAETNIPVEQFKSKAVDVPVRTTALEDALNTTTKAEKPIKLNQESKPKPKPKTTPKPKVSVKPKTTAKPKPKTSIEQSIEDVTGKTKSAPKKQSTEITKEQVAQSDETVNVVMGSGKRKVTKVARDIDETYGKAFDAVPEEERAKYSTISKKQQLLDEKKFIESDYEAAVAGATRGAPIPENINPQVNFETVKRVAVRNGDWETVRALESSPIATRRSLVAQELGASGYYEKMPADPVEAVKQVNKARTAAVEKVNKNVGKVKSAAKAEIKKNIKANLKLKQDWAEFVKSLPKGVNNKFVKLIRNGELTPEKLLKMTDAERRDFFAKNISKKNAPAINARFEAKLLLKNQKRGIITWLKKETGMNVQAKRDIYSRVNRMKDVLQPDQLDNFLEDLIAQRLGMRISREEGEVLMRMAQRVEKAKLAMEAGGDRMGYGRALVNFQDFTNRLKLNTIKVSPLGKIKQPGVLISDIAGTAKSAKASFDNSAIFRQGWKTMLTHPTKWLPNAVKSFRDFTRVMKGKNITNELKADILSRPNALNGFYQKARLDVGTVEEIFPTTWLEKVPLAGRVYKASEQTFMSFVWKTRADVFDTYIEVAKRSGVDLTDKVQLEQIGNLVNSLTGRGRLGRLEPSAGVVNNVFFSPRLLKSNIDVLTAHQFAKGVTPFVRKQALVNLLRITAGTAAVLTIANNVKPNSVEWDPRSSNFGKIKAGNTRFDVSGGMASLVTLASRLVTRSSKSSTTGKVTPLNSGDYGTMTGTDVVYNFIENKFSPATSVVKDYLRGEDFQGRKPTVGVELGNLFAPLPITNYQELANDPNSANVLLGVMADVMGINTNTYSVGTQNFDMGAFKNSTGSGRVLNTLNDLVKNAGYYPGKPSTTQGGQRLDSEQYQRFMKLYTNRFVKYMKVESSSAAYRNGDAEARKKIAAKVVARARAETRKVMGLE